MKKYLSFPAALVLLFPISTRLHGQSRPDLKNAVYIESKTGKKFNAHYIDSVFSAGVISFPDSTRDNGSYSTVYVTFLDSHQIADPTISPVYQDNIGKNIYSSFAGFSSYRQLSQNRLSGKVCLLHFWATTCGPCVRDLAEYGTGFQEYLSRKKIEIFNFSQEGSDLVERFLGKYPPHHFPGSFINSADPLFSELKVKALPTLFIVDKTGVITHIFVGDGKFSAIKDAIQKDLF